jgi:hypothetical protein
VSLTGLDHSCMFGIVGDAGRKSQSGDDGFEFSAEDLAAWLRRIELNNAVLRFRINGSLPAPPAEPDKKSDGKALP